MNWKSILSECCGESAVEHRFRDNVCVTIPEASLHRVLGRLKDEGGFNMLIDITAVDYLEYPDASDRFGVVYILLDTDSGQRLMIRVLLNEPDLELPTAVDLWRGADWMEREIFDMFGVRFAGHPDLRRILMPDEFTSFPLRKDYPLKGRGERHNFDVITRAES